MDIKVLLMESNVNKNKISILDYRHLIIGVVFFLLGVIPVLFSELTWFSFVFILLAVGNFLKFEIARKVAVITLIGFGIFIVFIFFPPFTENELVLKDQNEIIRIGFMLVIEVLVIGLMSLLRSKYE